MVKRIKVRDIISHEIHTVDPSITLLTAASEMMEHSIDALIVLPLEKDEPFGIITQKDIVDAFAEERDTGSLTVGEVSTKPLLIVSPGMPIVYAAKMFKKGRVNHLAVFNGKEIVGIISYADVLRALPELIRQIYSEFA